MSGSIDVIEIYKEILKSEEPRQSRRFPEFRMTFSIRPLEPGDANFYHVADVSLEFISPSRMAQSNLGRRPGRSRGQLPDRFLGPARSPRPAAQSGSA